MDGIPGHLAIIMDGNGRWAKARGLPRWAGHRAGAKAVRRTVEAAAEIGIETLTLFAFSSENWRRPTIEVETLFRLLEEHLRSELRKMLTEGIRFRAIGRRDRVPASARRLLEETEERTRKGKRMLLRLAIDYGGRAEIAAAARELAERVAAGKLRPEDIGEDLLGSTVSSDGVADPDLVIRTAGEKRLSNFLLWQVSYSELYFTPVLWPDFGREDIEAALADFGARDRRYGAVGTNAPVAAFGS